MSIFSELECLGYTPKQIMETAQGNPRIPGTATLAVDSQSFKADPTVGLNYTCYSSHIEEERLKDFLKAYNQSFTQIHQISVYDSSRVTFAVDFYADTMAAQVAGSYDYNYSRILEVQDFHDKTILGMTVSQMKAKAKTTGTSLQGKRSKDDIRNIVLSSEPKKRPDVWPAWFQNGTGLTLWDTSGIVKDTLKLLVKAAEENRIVIRNESTSSSHQFSMYDKSDR